MVEIYPALPLLVREYMVEIYPALPLLQVYDGVSKADEVDSGTCLQSAWQLLWLG
jgi:hypothetical protein